MLLLPIQAMESTSQSLSGTELNLSFSADSFIAHSADYLKYAIKIWLGINQIVSCTAASKKREKIAYIRELFSAFAQNNPIFALLECTCEHTSDCLLSRVVNPKYRQRFEDQVCSGVSATISKGNCRPVVYVSFGSGGLFQDMVILTKVLKKHPASNITLHCIEKSYAGFTTLKNCFVHTDPYECGKDLASFQYRYTKLVVQTRCKLFESWFKTHFPQASIELYLHDTCDTYLNALSGHSIVFPDVISAADIQSECSDEDGSADYKKLCKKILRNKKDCFNVWLAKNKRKTCAKLVYFSLNNKKFIRRWQFIK